MMKPGVWADSSQAENAGGIVEPEGQKHSEEEEQEKKWVERKWDERGESRTVCSTRSEPPPVWAGPRVPESSSLTFKECVADKTR